MNNTTRRIFSNIIFCIQILLVFLLFVENRIDLPVWLQVAGRLHPLILHLPIGFLIFMVILVLFQRQLGDDAAQKIIDIGLLLTSLSASATALFGFFLSLQDDYGSDAMMRHKIAGVLLSWFCYALMLWSDPGTRRKYFYGFGVLTLVILIVTGHTGAVLTHGQNFVLAPMASPPVLTVENASVYEFAVQPILDRKCFSCHNEAKAKGGLVMTSVEKFKKGGDNGKPWVEGSPKESIMVKAFYLPLDHDEHMPPDGKPQLTPIEIATIESWIKSGADFEKKLNQFADGDSLKFIVASFAASKVNVPVVEKQYNFEAVSTDVIDDLNTPFRSVFPLYLNSPALQADFFLKESFEAKSLEELKSVSEQLVVVNLSKMHVMDKDLNIIASFPNLENLNLNFTKVEGKGLAALRELKNLESLSLAGTSVTAKDLEAVLAMPKLRAVYIWNTKINAEEQEALRKKYPDIKIIGNLFSDVNILKLGKPRVENDGVIRKDELVSLKHSMPGVRIHLSKDLSVPDSVAGQLYERPFSLDESTVIKAKACKDGWYCSDVLEVTCFVEGIAPKNVTLITSPDEQYPGKGAASLTDLQKGFADIFKEPSWLGYRNQPFSASFDFGKGTSIHKTVISYGKNLGGFIFPPEEVEVWGGDDIDHLTLLKKVKPEQPKSMTMNGVEALSVPIDQEVSYRYYKLIAKPVAKLPAWHDSKGEKAWFFTDEVFFY
jgi:hypothetical protein